MSHENVEVVREAWRRLEGEACSSGDGARSALGWAKRGRRFRSYRKAFMKKLSTALAVAIAALSVFASAASATPPTHEPVSFADRTFSGQCSFDVFRHVLVNRSVLTTFSNGNRLTTGTFKERLTNLSTGEFIDVNASGPILAVFNEDGSSTEYLRGRQFVRPPGELLITTGLVVVERDPAGAIVGFTQIGGTTQDVCELLA